MSLPTLVLQDGETTPVDHTFEHSRIGPDFAQWDTPSSSEYIGREKVTMWMKRPSGGSKVANRNLKLHFKFEMPVLETVSNDTVTGIAPAPTVAFRPTFEGVFTFPERCTEQQRKNLRLLCHDLQTAVSYRDFIDKYVVPS